MGPKLNKPAFSFTLEISEHEPYAKSANILKLFENKDGAITLD